MKQATQLMYSDEPDYSQPSDNSAEQIERDQAAQNWMTKEPPRIQCAKSNLDELPF